MRVQPRPLITLGLAVVYMTIVGIVWAVVGLDYDAVGDSTSTVLKGIVLPIALGGVFLAGATSYLGWWGPSITETMRAPRWLWAVPVLMALPGLGALIGGAGTAGRGASYLLALAVGTLLVGFSEEMLTRGVGLVGLRGGFREVIAWALSCLLFGLIHALNLFFGQSFALTIQQIVLAFVAGSVFYITRRVSGTLILCMVLHAWVDFTTFAFSDAAADEESIFNLLGFAQYGAFILALVGVVVVLRRSGEQGSVEQEAHATA